MLFLDPFFDVRESRLSKFAQIKGPSYHHSSFKQTQGGSPFVSHLFQDKPFQGKPPFTYSVNKIDQPFQLPTPLRGKNLVAPPTWFSRAFVWCCTFQAPQTQLFCVQNQVWKRSSLITCSALIHRRYSWLYSSGPR